MRAPTSVLLLAVLSGCGPGDARIRVDPPDAEVALDGCPIRGKGHFRLPLSVVRDGIDPTLRDRRRRLTISRSGYQDIACLLTWRSTRDGAVDLKLPGFEGEGSIICGMCCMATLIGPTCISGWMYAREEGYWEVWCDSGTSSGPLRKDPSLPEDLRGRPEFKLRALPPPADPSESLPPGLRD